MGVITHVLSLSGDGWNLRFMCADFGRRTFFMEEQMRKKITNEKIGETIGLMAEKIRSDMDLDFRIAYGQMGISENELVETFDEEQLKLYTAFCQKRKIFFDLASEMYQRKI